MIRNVIKGNKIIVAIILSLLLAVIISFSLGRHWSAWLSSKDVLALARIKELPVKFNGILISNREILKTYQCYNIYYDLLQYESSRNIKDKNSTIFHEHLNAILVEADVFSNKLLAEDEIQIEAESLWSIVNIQAARRGVQLDSLFDKYDISRQDLENSLREQAILRLVKDRIYSEKEIKESDVKEFYEQNKENYFTPPKVQVLMITVNDLADAETAWKEISSGTDFFDVLIKYNDKIALAENTYKFWVKEGQLSTQLDKVIFDMEIGEKRGIVTTSEGYHIIKVENVIEAQLQEFESIRNIVITDFKELQANNKWEEYITQLRANTNIIVWH